MSDLAIFQQSFGAALEASDLGSEPAMARALAIHRNTSHRAAQTALADNYPVVAALVGEDAFALAASDFVRHSPPNEPRLCLYGEGFPDFLSAYLPFAEHSYLADVARVERLVIEALFAADAEVRDAGAFTEIDLEAPLQLHPAVRTEQTSTPAVSLWLAHQCDAAADAIQTIVWQAECALITRPGNRIAVASETPAAIAFIEACANRQPLGIAAGVAGDELADVFARTISAGCFARFRDSGDAT